MYNKAKSVVNDDNYWDIDGQCCWVGIGCPCHPDLPAIEWAWECCTTTDKPLPDGSIYRYGAMALNCLDGNIIICPHYWENLDQGYEQIKAILHEAFHSAAAGESAAEDLAVRVMSCCNKNDIKGDTPDPTGSSSGGGSGSGWPPPNGRPGDLPI